MYVRLHKPVKLSDLFTVQPDSTDWGMPDYRKILSKKDKPAGQTPIRDRATFGNWTRSLTPISAAGSQLAKEFGLYLLAFTIPRPFLYVGIAAGDSRSAEGILNRVKKHRVKTTGSHVGSQSRTNGGVDHTRGWREFALARAAAVQGIDLCSDARLIVGNVYETNLETGAEERPKQRKSILEYFESCIFNNVSGVRSQISQLLWQSDHKLITTHASSLGLAGPTPSISLWC